MAVSAGTSTTRARKTKKTTPRPKGRPIASDPIALEVLRNRLEAIAEDSAMTIERTAISPIVTESKDYSATLLDADGNLVAGGGSGVLPLGCRHPSDSGDHRALQRGRDPAG